MQFPSFTFWAFKASLLICLCANAFSFAQNNSAQIHLVVSEKELTVQGKKATIYTLAQPDGKFGLFLNKGERFDVSLENHLLVPTSIHWHGLILPNSQDGVAFITQLPLYPGQAYTYQFPIVQAGTFWMHSHYGLQEQRLLGAPLILRGAEDVGIADQDVVVMLNDFSFKSPQDIYESLRCDCKKREKMKSMVMKGGADLVEVDYDAFLANFRTLDNSELFEVKPGAKVRLRVINGSSATNFLLSLPNLKGSAIAVDGSRTKPLLGSHFEVAVAQRIDILVTIPQEGGAFPLLAQGEGTDKQAGIILATKGVELPQLSPKADKKAGALTNGQEYRLTALRSLPKRQVDLAFIVELGGDMVNYVWTLNGESWPEVTPLVVEEGQRVAITFKNSTAMAHPMHLHGHVFQITSINGREIEGAVRDTVLVMPHSTLTIQFDADNPGVWPLHCHLLYHLEAGMLTVVRYKDFIQPLVNVQRE